ncbi:MAG: hypothetical protein AB1405_10970 [Bdellovibrionota bacterium]
MKTKQIWISYDLGLNGDYDGLYRWFDAHGAKECGDRLATLEFNVKRDLQRELEKDLKKAFKVGKEDRLYVIYRDSETNKVKGRFLFGGRRAAPWIGTSQKLDEVVEDAG